jgi:predicted acyltransferase
MAGVILSKLFLEKAVASTLRSRLLWGAGFAAVLFVSGWLLLPFGLSKIGSTPSWCLLSAGYVVVLFMLIYYMVDIKGVYKWASIIKPAGSNPLLTYLLPDIYYAIVGLYHFRTVAGEGWPGVVRAFLFTLFILGISAIMTRYKIRLQL